MTDKTIVCRCEAVTYGEIRDTVEEHACSSREVKLRTRAGMGYCGGRTCRNVIDRIVSEVNSEPIPDEPPLSYRSPIRPIPFEVVGGGNYDTES